MCPLSSCITKNSRILSRCCPNNFQGVNLL
nr:MAG TPA: hypothetical protein [Caudoviricetes sp.]